MARTLRDVPVHPGSMFTWNGKAGSAEASDFRGPVADRLYDDACDCGFYVLSRRTGRRVLFTFDRPIVKAGETMGFLYTSPEGFRVTIWND